MLQEFDNYKTGKILNHLGENSIGRGASNCKCISTQNFIIHYTFGETRRSWEIRYNKHVSEIECKKSSLKSHFIKRGLEHQINIRFNREKYLIILNKKKIIVFKFSVTKIFCLQ